MDVALIGVPFNSSGGTAGEARAPAALRAAGLVDALATWGKADDAGDVSFAPPVRARDPATGIIGASALVEMVTAVRDAVGGALDAGRFPVVVGGECPLLLGCLAAARDRHGRIGLLFVDGHEDAWPPLRSTTGESADMELGFATSQAIPTGMPTLDALLPLVAPEDTAAFGPRNGQEIAGASVASVAGRVGSFLDAAALRAAGVVPPIAAATERFAATTGRWWFHLDLDVLATDSLAAIRYPQPGGLSWHELDAGAATALTVPGALGLDLTIYNPDLDPSGDGGARIVAFVRRLGLRLAGG